MESRDNSTVPAPSTPQTKGRDFEPVPTTSDIKPDDTAAGPPKPYDIDPSDCRPGSGEPQH